MCVSNREDVERRFEGKLSKHMSGSLYEMVSRVMKALVNRKITVPGNFQGYVSNLAVKNLFFFFFRYFCRLCLSVAHSSTVILALSASPVPTRLLQAFFTL